MVDCAFGALAAQVTHLSQTENLAHAVDFFAQFFILSGISAVLSSEPLVSIGKMRAASLFLIFYLFVENIPSKKVARGLALTLVASCLINVFYTAATRVVGRGIKIEVSKLRAPWRWRQFRHHGRLPAVANHEWRHVARS